MAKNIVVCLDGTNNKLRAAINTNVVRLFAMLDLSRPDQLWGSRTRPPVLTWASMRPVRTR